MKVLQKGTLPDGTKIQIEDWSQTYANMPYAGTVATYPTATQSGDQNRFEPQRGDKFRLAFDFESTEAAAKCFEQLTSGKMQLADFAEHLDRPQNLNFIK